MLPDFNRLKVFYYIYARKSIVSAAAELHITQSAVSQHLRKLEDELKTPLFTRLHKKLVPTAAGERLFNIVGPFIDELEAGVDNINQSREKPSGLLRIGSPPEFGKEYLPPLIASFRKKHPDVTFFLEFGHSDFILPMLKEGELDFALIDAFLAHDLLFGDYSIYSSEPLVEEEIILSCSKDYYNREINGDHSFENLITKEFISFQNNSLPNWFRRHFNKKVDKLNVVMTVESHHAVKLSIKHGLGLGITASHLLCDNVSQGNIIPIVTGKKEIINLISLVQLQDKVPSLTEKYFQNHLKQEIQSGGILDAFCRISGT